MPWRLVSQGRTGARQTPIVDGRSASTSASVLRGHTAAVGSLTTETTDAGAAAATDAASVGKAAAAGGGCGRQAGGAAAATAGAAGGSGLQQQAATAAGSGGLAGRQAVSVSTRTRLPVFPKTVGDTGARDFQRSDLREHPPAARLSTAALSHGWESANSGFDLHEHGHVSHVSHDLGGRPPIAGEGVTIQGVRTKIVYPVSMVIGWCLALCPVLPAAELAELVAGWVSQPGALEQLLRTCGE